MMRSVPRRVPARDATNDRRHGKSTNPQLRHPQSNTLKKLIFAIAREKGGCANAKRTGKQIKWNRMHRQECVDKSLNHNRKLEPRKVQRPDNKSPSNDPPFRQ